MPKYEVEWTERRRGVVIVEAESRAEAKEKVASMWESDFNNTVTGEDYESYATEIT